MHMRLGLLLVAMAACGVCADLSSATTTAPPPSPASPSPASPSPAPSPSPRNTSAQPERMEVATSCEQLGLVSISVRGAPNAFCVAANTCNTNYTGNCPGAQAVDSKGAAMATGSCCAALENTGDVGCVSLALVQSGTFQCLKHAGASDSAAVVDISKMTLPPPTTTAPPPPTTTAPPSRSDGSREALSDAGATSPPPTTTTTKPTLDTTEPTPSPPTATTATPKRLASSASPSSSWSSSGSSSRSHEPQVSIEPTVTTPLVLRPTTSLPAPTGPLEALAPIPDPPRQAPSRHEHTSSSTTTSSPKNPMPFSATGKSSTASGNSFASALNGNVVLVLVMGSVASVAVVLGAFLLRRRSSDKSSSSAASLAPTCSASQADKLVSPGAKRTLTLDGDEDLYNDLQFRQADHFSPIFVQPTHSYAESRTPSHDRPSYQL